MSEVANKVKEIIVEKLGVEASEVTETASFTNDLGADSLDTVELIMEFEREFDIQIAEEDAEKITTVGEAIAHIEAAKASGATPFYIITRHLIPNCISTVIVLVTLGIPNAIMYEASLSFLGMGIVPPTASWALLKPTVALVNILTNAFGKI